MKVALDTTNILGRGTVKDTCNLLADGIVQLIRPAGTVEGPQRRTTRAKRQGYHRRTIDTLGSSVQSPGRHRQNRLTGPDGAAGRG